LWQNIGYADELGPSECEIQVPYREEMATIQTSKQCRQRFLLGKTQGIGRPGLLKTFACSECDIVRMPRLEGVLRNKGAQARVPVPLKGKIQKSRQDAGATREKAHDEDGRDA
jgi:hypothetical protein